MKFPATLFLLFFSTVCYAQSLQNQFIQLELSATPNGSPMIKRAVSTGDGRMIFEHQSPHFFMDDWGPQELAASSEKQEWKLTSDELYETMRADSLARAEKFTWEKTADKTIGVFKSYVKQ